MTALEKLMNDQYTTQGQLLSALMLHEVFLALEPPRGDNPLHAAPLRQNNGSGDFVLVAASLRAAELLGLALSSKGTVSPYTHMGRLKILPLVLERYQDIGIQLIGRSSTGNSFNTILIEADTIADIRTDAEQLAETHKQEV